MYSLSSGLNDRIFTLHYADSMPALSRAATENDLNEIKKLLSSGKLPQTPDNRGWTCIHWCVASGHIEALKLIFKLKSKNKKYLANLSSWENVTPLMIALKASSPSLEIVKVLLKAGASPELYTHTNLSPLHLACLKKGNIEFVKLLVQYGANVNVQEDLAMFTPLHFVVSEAQDLEMIKYLMEISDLSLRNVYKRTAFLEACNVNFVTAVELFLQKDKNLANVKSEIPPLVYAVFQGSLKMTEVLIECGADVNHRCSALISCKTNDSSLLILEVGKFLPIHSSLKNIEVFKLLLSLTNPSEIIDASSNFCTFPLFVMVHSNDVIFYEMLLQSSLPYSLKTITSRMLINFILNCPEKSEIVFKKFPLFFKYNFYLEPQDVFQDFIWLTSEDELLMSFRFLHILAEMGISLGDQFLILPKFRAYVNEHKDSEKAGVIREICHLLEEPVLSLKQLSRIIVRRHVKSLVKNDWLAFKMINECCLPDCLKRFLFFETFK